MPEQGHPSRRLILKRAMAVGGLALSAQRATKLFAQATAAPTPQCRDGDDPTEPAIEGPFFKPQSRQSRVLSSSHARPNAPIWLSPQQAGESTSSKAWCYRAIVVLLRACFLICGTRTRTATTTIGASAIAAIYFPTPRGDIDSAPFFPGSIPDEHAITI